MMNNLRGAYTIWYRDMLRFWRDKMRLIGAVVLPLLFLFVFGSGMGSMMGALSPGVNFSQFIFPGIIGMTVLMTSFMSGVSVVWDREFGFLKEVLVAPISRASVAAGKTLGAATIAVIQGAIILCFAPLIDFSLAPATVALLLPSMFLLAVAMGSFGVLLATRIKTMEAFQAIMPMLTFPMIFLSGVFYPIEAGPVWMSVISKINPATYGTTIIRQVALRGVPGATFDLSLFGHTMSLWDNVGILAAFAAVMILLGMHSFSRQE
ncbi:MAG: ABC transporter permease [Dehalococcoidales bacterium]|jgi:ABC-2 type transport system permease protein|nr:ABC transporter permease [Dehalococcoidales bacterium]